MTCCFLLTMNFQSTEGRLLGSSCSQHYRLGPHVPSPISVGFSMELFEYVFEKKRTVCGIDHRIQVVNVKLCRVCFIGRTKETVFSVTRTS